MDKRIFYGVRSRVEETDNCTNITTDIITKADTMIPPSTYEEYEDYDEYIDWFFTMGEAQEFIRYQTQFN